MVLEGFRVPVPEDKNDVETEVPGSSMELLMKKYFLWVGTWNRNL